MRSTTSLALMAALSVSGCSPFAMENATLGLEGSGRDYHLQSYYIPKTILTATVTSDGDALNLTTGWEKVVDRKFLFKVDYQPSILHEDTIHVETDAKGFLKGVQAFSEDKTSEIVEAAANILMTTIRRTPGQNRTLQTGELPDKQLLAVQFDPFDPIDFEIENRLLQERGYCFAVLDHVDQPLPGSCSGNGSLVQAVSSEAVDQKGDGAWNGHGFFYRRAVEHRVVIFQRSSARWRPIWSGWHQFEQQGDLSEIRIDRGMFIKLEATLNFTEGSLTKYTIKKPSELLGFMKIPTTIVNTIVQIPGLEIDAAENANALKKRELDVREEELKLRDRELKMQQAVSADGTRVFYTPIDGASRSASADFSTTARSLAEEKQRRLSDCRDQYGLSEEDCEAAWVRSGGT